MKIDYDKVADAIYFTVKSDKVARSIKVDNRLVVDLSSTGDIVGMELLGASLKQGQELEKNFKQGVPINIISATPVSA